MKTSILNSEYLDKRSQSKLVRTTRNVIGLSLFTILFSFSNVFSQNVKELSIAVSELEKSSIKEGTELKQLLFDLQPTVYIKNGAVVRGHAATPVRINTDALSLQLLNQPNELFSTVKALVINIQNESDLNRISSMGTLSSLTNLKYVHIQCAFEICPKQLHKADCEIAKIGSLINKEMNSELNVLYSAAIPN